MKKETTMKKKLYKYLKLLTCILLLLALFSTMIVVKILNNKQSVVYNNLTDFPDMSFNGELDFEGDASCGIEIPASRGYNLLHSQTEQDIKFSNPNGNKCDFIISIYLSDGTIIYRSERIKPGVVISKVTLLQTLQAGVYKNVVVTYDCYQCGTQVPITRVETVVELNCI